MSSVNPRAGGLAAAPNSKRPRAVAYVGDSLVGMGVSYGRIVTTPTATWIQELGTRSDTFQLTTGSIVIEYAAATDMIRYTAPGDAAWGTGLGWTAVKHGIMKLKSTTAGKEFLVGIRKDLLPAVDTTTGAAASEVVAATYPTVGGNCVSFTAMAQMLSGHAFRCVSIHGVPGDSLAHIRARLSDVFVYDTYMNAIAYQPDIVVVEGGTNDVVLYSRTSAQITADIKGIVETIKARGSTPVLVAIPARFGSGATPLTTEQYNTMQVVNDYMALLAAEDSAVHFVDAHSSTRDPATLTGTPLANYTQTDGVHLTNLGAYRVGKAVSTKLVELNGGVTGRGTCRRGGDPLNLVANPAFIGTAGTAGTGASGTIPTSWTVNRSGSGLLVASSVESVANEMPWLVLTTSGPVAAGDIAQAFAVVTGATVGSAVMCEAEFDVSAAVGLLRLEVLLYFYSASVTRYASVTKLYGTAAANYALPDAAFSGVARLPLEGITVPAGTTTVRMYVGASFAASGSGVVKFRAPLTKLVV